MERSSAETLQLVHWPEMEVIFRGFDPGPSDSFKIVILRLFPYENHRRFVLSFGCGIMSRKGQHLAWLLLECEFPFQYITCLAVKGPGHGVEESANANENRVVYYFI